MKGESPDSSQRGRQRPIQKGLVNQGTLSVKGHPGEDFNKRVIW